MIVLIFISFSGQSVLFYVASLLVIIKNGKSCVEISLEARSSVSRIRGIFCGKAFMKFLLGDKGLIFTVTSYVQMDVLVLGCL